MEFRLNDEVIVHKRKEADKTMKIAAQEKDEKFKKESENKEA